MKEKIHSNLRVWIFFIYSYIEVFSRGRAVHFVNSATQEGCSLCEQVTCCSLCEQLFSTSGLLFTL